MRGLFFKWMLSSYIGKNTKTDCMKTDSIIEVNGLCASFEGDSGLTEVLHEISFSIGAGKTLGIAGLGTIGSAVANAAEAFGMNVVALAREGSAPDTDANRPRVQAEEFFSHSDIISLHCPLTSDTEKMINAETLAQMPDHGLLINTGRGPLVDEQALADAPIPSFLHRASPV